MYEYQKDRGTQGFGGEQSYSEDRLPLQEVNPYHDGIG